METNNRPKLTDPAEFALIKEMYFNNDKRDTVEREELLERQISKRRNTNNQSR